MPPDRYPEHRRDSYHLLDSSTFWYLIMLVDVILGVELVALVLQSQWPSVLPIAAIIALTNTPPVLVRRLNDGILGERWLAGTVVLALGSLVASEVFRYYDRLPWWDSVLHFWAGFLLGIVGLLLILAASRRPSLGITLGPGFTAISAFLFAVAGGVTWEVFEFTVDQLLERTMQGLEIDDTMWDLIFDATGGAVLAILVWLRLGRLERSYPQQ